MNKTFLLFISFLLLVSLLPVHAQDSEEPEFEMVQYYFVELIRNPDKPEIDSSEIMEIQQGHMDNMTRMVKDGKLLCAGPFGDGKGGGIWVLNVGTIEEAEQLCENDPAVMNKRLNYEIRPWWTSTGTFVLEKNE